MSAAQPNCESGDSGMRSSSKKMLGLGESLSCAMTTDAGRVAPQNAVEDENYASDFHGCSKEGWAADLGWLVSGRRTVKNTGSHSWNTDQNGNHGTGGGCRKGGGFQCFSPRRQILQQSGKRILDGWIRSGGTAVRVFNHGRHGSTPKGRISGGLGWLALTMKSGLAERPNSNRG